MAKIVEVNGVKIRLGRYQTTFCNEIVVSQARRSKTCDVCKREIKDGEVYVRRRYVTMEGWWVENHCCLDHYDLEKLSRFTMNYR